MLLDIRMSRCDGIEATRVSILTTYDTPELMSADGRVGAVVVFAQG
jgi:hypothetical protein